MICTYLKYFLSFIMQIDSTVSKYIKNNFLIKLKIPILKNAILCTV